MFPPGANTAEETPASAGKACVMDRNGPSGSRPAPCHLVRTGDRLTVFDAEGGARRLRIEAGRVMVADGAETAEVKPAKGGGLVVRIGDVTYHLPALKDL